MKKLSVFVFLAAVAFSASFPTDVSAKGKKEARLWSDSEVKWKVDAQMKDFSSAVLWGDPAKGAHGGLLKFAAGLSIPLHHHSFDNRGAVLSGTMILTLEGQPAKELGPGSLIFLPGNMKHTTACKAGTDCVIYAEQPGKDDAIMAEAPKK